MERMPSIYGFSCTMAEVSAESYSSMMMTAFFFRLYSMLWSIMAGSSPSGSIPTAIPAFLTARMKLSVNLSSEEVERFAKLKWRTGKGVNG